jgi:GTP-binding protein HflX
MRWLRRNYLQLLANTCQYKYSSALWELPQQRQHALVRAFSSVHRAQVEDSSRASARPPLHAQRSHEILVVHPRHVPNASEAIKLASSLVDAPVAHAIVGPARHPPRPHPATYLGAGTVERLAEHCETSGFPPSSRIFVNAVLTGVQQRTLEQRLRRPVLDRIGIILEIFRSRARTREARLQVELAHLDYAASRLVRVRDPATGKRRGFGMRGEVQVVSARERGRSGASSGGLGGSAGAGESELALQARRIAQRRSVLIKRLESVKRTRALQRAGRRRAGVAVIALVGYTNAGKSSLLKALSKARDVEAAEDKLFATLDPTFRRVELPSGRPAVIADTVGFISQLPHQLVAAFRATLEEVVSADVLVLVSDGSVEESVAVAQREVVMEVLKGLGIGEEKFRNGMIEAVNKIDLAEDNTCTLKDVGDAVVLDSVPGIGGAGERQQVPVVATSAKYGRGLQKLLELIDERLEHVSPPVMHDFARPPATVEGTATTRSS